MFDSIASTGAGAYVPQPVWAAAGNHATAAATTGQPEPEASGQGQILYSPNVIRVDPISHIAIFETRNPETGDVTQQYPSTAVVDEYRRISQGQATPATIAAANALGANIPQSAITAGVTAPGAATGTDTANGKAAPAAPLPGSEDASSDSTAPPVTGVDSPGSAPAATAAPAAKPSGTVSQSA